MKSKMFLLLSFLCVPLIPSENGGQRKFQNDDIIEITCGKKKGLKGFVACTAMEAWHEYCSEEQKAYGFSLNLAVSRQFPILAEYIAQIIPRYVWEQAEKHSTDKRGEEILNNYLRAHTLDDVYYIDTEDNKKYLAHESWLKECLPEKITFSKAMASDETTVLPEKTDLSKTSALSEATASNI